MGQAVHIQKQIASIQNQFCEEEIKEIHRTLKMLLKQASRDDYIKIFNEFDSNGAYFTKSRMYKVKALLDKNILRDILKKVDVLNLYHSVNTYKTRIEATENNMSQLLNIVIDVDYTKSFFYRNFSPNSFLKHLETEVYGQFIPCPSVSVYTGNNFHLVYYLKSSVTATKKVKALAKRIQKHITKELKEFNADRSVNLTTMTRCTMSVNSKTGNQVKYKVHNKTYFLSDLREYLPELPEWYGEWKEKKKKGKSKGVKHLFAHNTDNDKIREVREFSLLKARLQDLEKLQELRDYKCYGKREIMCFLYRNFAIQVMTSQEAEEAMYKFNGQFKSPLIEKRIESKTRLVERRTYKYKHETLINEVLEIDPEEQKYMVTIISKEEGQRRQKERDKLKDQRRKEERRNENGLTKRQQEKADKIQKVKELYRQGYNKSEIAKKIGISRQLVHRYLKI